MKNLIKTSIIVAAISVGMFSYANSMVTAEFDPLNSISAESSSSPRTLYNTHCSSCHGRDGKANTAKGRETDADDLTTGKVQGMSTSKIAGIIKKGKGDMPGFGSLTTSQISQIVSHVKAF